MCAVAFCEISPLSVPDKNLHVWVGEHVSRHLQHSCNRSVSPPRRAGLLPCRQRSYFGFQFALCLLFLLPLLPLRGALLCNARCIRLHLHPSLFYPSQASAGNRSRQKVWKERLLTLCCIVSSGSLTDGRKKKKSRTATRVMADLSRADLNTWKWRKIWQTVRVWAKE